MAFAGSVKSHRRYSGLRIRGRSFYSLKRWGYPQGSQRPFSGEPDSRMRRRRHLRRSRKRCVRPCLQGYCTRHERLLDTVRNRRSPHYAASAFFLFGVCPSPRFPPRAWPSLICPMMIPQSPKSIDDSRNYSDVSSAGRAICGSLRHLINVEEAAVVAARLVRLDVDVPVDVGGAIVPTFVGET